MADQRPDPHHTQPGQPAKAGQFTTYVYRDEAGHDKYNAVITGAFEISDDGNYQNVACCIFEPATGKPIAEFENRGKVYWINGEFAGMVSSDPCGPPWPG